MRPRRRLAATRRRLARSGFTLLEVLLVLFLLGVASTLVVVGARGLLPDDRDPPAEERLRRAIAAARREAVESQNRVVLQLDPETGEFLVRPAGEEATEEEEAPIGSWSRPPSTPLPAAVAGAPPESRAPVVRLLRRRPTSGQFLVGGRVEDTDPIDRVVFSPDGSCTPFVVAIGEGPGERRIEIDPWTTAPREP